MAQKQQERTMLLVPLDKARAQISERIKEGRRLLELPIGNEAERQHARDEEKKWSKHNVTLLESVVNTRKLVNDYNLGYVSIPVGRPSLYEWAEQFRSDIKAHITNLESILSYLPVIPGSPTLAQPAEPQPVDSRLEVGRRVFIVHGHDEEAKQSLARCLEKLELKPIILHEQPSQGRTIIEKFEGYAGVGFAVVLLTPDDVGAAKDDVDNFKPRARQNVVFELGFFVGKLGRDRVCALHKGDVEIPSDFAGVVYVPMGPGDAWRFDLVREMNAAGLDVDSNKLL
jgi:predicted nucleotide-binding protein